MSVDAFIFFEEQEEDGVNAGRSRQQKKKGISAFWF